jgi:uncharacterized protein (DUF4415 family)
MPEIIRPTPEEDAAITRAAEADPDSRPLSDEEWRTMRPVRGPQRAPTKVAVSIRLDADLVERLKSEGIGWQSRANAMLRRAAGLD